MQDLLNLAFNNIYQAGFVGKQRSHNHNFSFSGLDMRVHYNKERGRCMLQIFKFDNISVQEEIRKFEEKYKITFPQLYLLFLEKYNGGNTPKTTFKINGVSSDIRAFYCFGNMSKDEDFSFLVKNNLLENFLDENFCPIATDSLGNQIVIGIGKDNNGEIYFFDEETSKYTYLSENLREFFTEVKSKKFIVRSVEERIQKMKEVGSKIEVNDELIALWQSEIDKYSGNKPEFVII